MLCLAFFFFFDVSFYEMFGWNISSAKDLDVTKKKKKHQPFIKNICVYTQFNYNNEHITLISSQCNCVFQLFTFAPLSCTSIFFFSHSIQNWCSLPSVFFIFSWHSAKKLYLGPNNICPIFSFFCYVFH